MPEKKKITTHTLRQMKQKQEPISVLTAYDFLTGRLLDEVGIEVILVGDSAGMVIHGRSTTLNMTMDQMVDHTRAVRRGVRRALVVTDMPFLSYQVSWEETMQNAGRFMKEAGSEAIKLEGGEIIAPQVEKLVRYGIPVMGHLGLTPQSIHKFGSYKVRAVSKSEAETLKKEAKILQEAGIFALVLEKIPSTLATEVTQSLNIPTIGIGAGGGCDGQVLVTQDMLGLYEDFSPRFIRQYGRLAEEIRKSVRNYIKDVKSRDFPSEAESY